MGQESPFHEVGAIQNHSILAHLSVSENLGAPVTLLFIFDSDKVTGNPPSEKAMPVSWKYVLRF